VLHATDAPAPEDVKREKVGETGQETRRALGHSKYHSSLDRLR